MTTTTIERTRPVACRPLESRIRLLVRWSMQIPRFMRAGWFDFAGNAARAIALLAWRSAVDLVGRSDARTCNMCGWTGSAFYPNNGPGYFETATTCPGCLILDRHRTLVAVLAARTTMFDVASRVVEVAPMRRFEAFLLAQERLDYTSFDLERHAMEQGDITAMRYADDTVDWFLCFHVLEHIPDELTALTEVRRVLRPGGTLVIQVPVDETQATTVEYGAPDPRDTNHVRRYGRDFGAVLAAHGFVVTICDPADIFDADTIERHGLNIEPVYLARKPVDPT